VASPQVLGNQTMNVYWLQDSAPSLRRAGRTPTSAWCGAPFRERRDTPV